MASGDISTSDSDLYAGHGRPRRSSSRASSKMENLASTLQDTNRNLKAVDHLLDEYRGMGDKQSDVMERLKDDLAHTSLRLKEERRKRSRSRERPLRTSDLGGPRPTSPYREYDFERAQSDWEYSTTRKRVPYNSVRFYDDMHDVHQSVRDTTSNQWQLGQDLNREIDRRNRVDYETKKTFTNLATTMDKESVMSSVDRRLQSIQDELRTERTQLKKKQDDVGKVSTELKEALQQQKVSTIDEQLRAKLSQTESQRHMVESELESYKRKLDQSEGGRKALHDQLDELRRQLARAHEERDKLREHIHRQDEELRDRKNKITLEERERSYRDKEKQRIEEELRELRSQVGRSASVVGNYGELQKELESSEKQRNQLSDHIQVLQSDMESKEKQCAKVITQLQELSELLKRVETDKQQLQMRVEDTSRQLKDKTKELENASSNVTSLKAGLEESDRKREEIKVRAQETVRQWKLKCKKLERESDMFKHSAEQASDRTEQLIKELEGAKSHSTLTSQQVEHLKREFTTMLQIRAQQEEDIRVKDVQVNEMKSLKNDLERDLRDCKVVIERLEHELHSSKERISQVLEEKTKYEDQVGNMQSATIMAQNQLQNMQREIKELSLMKVELSAQLAQAANERGEYKLSMQDAKRGEASAREEIEILTRRLQEEKELHNHRLEATTFELNKHKSQEAQKIQEISRRYKKERAEYEAELQALKLELQEERAGSKSLRRQTDKHKSEIDRIQMELVRSREETAEIQVQYHKAREDFISKSQVTEDGLSRVRELELNVFDAKQALRSSQKDYQNMFQTIACEVDGVIELVAIDSMETFKAISLNKTLPDDPKKQLAEIRSKLAWLKVEVREKREKENKLRGTMKDVVLNNEKDRQYLIAEIERKKTALDELAYTKSDSNKKDEVTELCEKVDTLMDTVEDEKRKQRRKSVEIEIETQQLSEDVASLKDVCGDREEILTRYSKLQDTMSVLRQELTETKLYADILKSNRVDIGSTPTTPTKRNRRVRISSPPCRDPPPHRDPSPKRPLSPILRGSRDNSPYRSRDRTPSPGRVTRSPGRVTRTPPPLALTDEEFNMRFLPKTPPRLEGLDDCYSSS